MSEEAPETHASAHAEVTPGEAHHSSGPISPDIQMLIWTWITFGLVATLLYKKAWKPILAGLDAREARIHQALADADKARQALAEIEATRNRLIAETERECKTMIAESRDGAVAVANSVEKKAQERVKVLYENAERDIEAMKNRVVAEIRREEADLIVSVSGRLIAQNLNTDSNRALADKLIKEF